MQNTYPLVIVLTAIISFAAGVLLGFFLPTGGVRSLSAGSGNTTMPLPTSPDGQLHALSGQIKAISGDSLILSAVLPGNMTPSNITVQVSDDTAITRTVIKDQVEFSREMRAFEANGSSANGPATPPLPHDIVDVAPSELEVGWNITVTPVSGTAEGATRFQAASISIFDVPTPATMAPAQTPTALPGSGPARTLTPSTNPTPSGPPGGAGEPARAPTAQPTPPPAAPAGTVPPGAVTPAMKGQTP